MYSQSLTCMLAKPLHLYHNNFNYLSACWTSLCWPYFGVFRKIKKDEEEKNVEVVFWQSWPFMAPYSFYFHDLRWDLHTFLFVSCLRVQKWTLPKTIAWGFVLFCLKLFRKRQNVLLFWAACPSSTCPPLPQAGCSGAINPEGYYITKEKNTHTKTPTFKYKNQKKNITKIQKEDRYKMQKSNLSKEQAAVVQ